VVAWSIGGDSHGALGSSSRLDFALSEMRREIPFVAGRSSGQALRHSHAFSVAVS